ncbi:hypothetical protein BGP77_04565 [Saccharospirillum sp. MSK14-1]|uniref:hypothetical protein n=1 Tax=Saccharospirillum sp. MSK14-1 TaxID=1897632 RepID=UPI000D3BC9C2|nr:hypothetical protein [Saccharospirillum sp. MSK14-1]PTY36574.1 hypothetical protein BGP77_04565 [Saccharospirillum sp. MSK14-1]
MALLTLSQKPDAQQLALFNEWLTANDWVLLSGDARTMLWHPNPLPAQGCIRHEDAQSMAGKAHSDWLLIHDHDWVRLSAEHSPLVHW